MRPQNLMKGRLGPGARNSLPEEVIQKIEPGLDYLFSDVRKKILAIKRDAEAIARELDGDVEPEHGQAFMNKLTAACSGAVSTMVRKWFRPSTTPRRRSHQRSRHYRPQAAGSDIRTDLGECVKEALGELSSGLEESRCQIATQTRTHKQEMQGWKALKSQPGKPILGKFGLSNAKS